MQQFGTVCCWIALLWSGTTFAQTPVLRWCLDNFPGFHEFSAPNLPPTGPSVVLLQQLAQRAGFTLQISDQTPSARCFRDMQSGQADLMSNLNYTDERAGYMVMLPYRKRLPEAVFLRADDTRSVNSVADLQALRLVSVRGFSYHPEYMQALSARPLTERIEVASIADGLLMLTKGRGDALIAPAASTSYLIESDVQFHFKFRKAGLALTSKDHRFVYLGLSKAQAQWAPHLRQAIKTLQDEGIIDQLYGPRENVESDKIVQPRQQSPAATPTSQPMQPAGDAS